MDITHVMMAQTRMNHFVKVSQLEYDMFCRPITHIKLSCLATLIIDPLMYHQEITCIITYYNYFSKKTTQITLVWLSYLPLISVIYVIDIILIMQYSVKI